MTREEALKIVRENYPHFGTTEPWLDLEKALATLIPELAESEDERIRKAIESIIRVYGKTQGEWIAGYDMDTLVVHLRDAFACLEKQKDLDKMIVVSPEVWDNAISEAYENGKKEGEKQKEQKPLTAEETELNSIAFLEQMGYTCIPPGKEQKPNCKYECPLTDEQLMTTDFWKAYLKESLIPGAKPNKQDIEFLLPTARNYFSLIMKDVCTICKDWSNGYRKGLESGKQKPVERSLEDDHIIGFVYDLLNEIEWKDNWAMSKEECLRLLSNYIPQKSAEKQDYSDLTDLERAILRGFLAAGMENVPVTIIKETAKECLAQMKPAEWSEEDKKNLKQCIEIVGGWEVDYDYANSHYSNWLKSLPERFNLPLKEEWSEVELEFRGEKVKVKRPFFRDDKGRGYSTTEQDEEVAWNALRAWCEKKGISLYDLYPKVEWSEEDEKMRNLIIETLDDNSHYFPFKETKMKMIDWFKSLCPRSK